MLRQSTLNNSWLNNFVSRFPSTPRPQSDTPELPTSPRSVASTSVLPPQQPQEPSSDTTAIIMKANPSTNGPVSPYTPPALYFSQLESRPLELCGMNRPDPTLPPDLLGDELAKMAKTLRQKRMENEKSQAIKAKRLDQGLKESQPNDCHPPPPPPPPAATARQA